MSKQSNSKRTYSVDEYTELVQELGVAKAKYLILKLENEQLQKQVDALLQLLATGDDDVVVG